MMNRTPVGASSEHPVTSTSLTFHPHTSLGVTLNSRGKNNSGAGAEVLHVLLESDRKLFNQDFLCSSVFCLRSRRGELMHPAAVAKSSEFLRK